MTNYDLDPRNYIRDLIDGQYRRTSQETREAIDRTLESDREFQFRFFTASLEEILAHRKNSTR